MEVKIGGIYTLEENIFGENCFNIFIEENDRSYSILEYDTDVEILTRNTVLSILKNESLREKGKYQNISKQLFAVLDNNINGYLGQVPDKLLKELKSCLG